MHPSRQIPVLLFCFAMTGYFVYHAIEGRHGFEARAELLERVRVLEPRLLELEAVRSRLAHTADRLSGNTPDPELVAEIAYRHLRFYHPNDMVVQLDAASWLKGKHATNERSAAPLQPVR